MEILLILGERAGSLVSKPELIARVWPGMHVEDGALRVHVSALRKVLGDDPAAPRYIFNVAGQGYQLVAATTIRAQLQNAEESKSETAWKPGAHAIGREPAIQRVSDNLRHGRFVTITGAGGIGKTTVALAVAERLASGYRHDATFVDLASLSDPQLLPGTLASALQLRITTSDPVAELIGWLKQRQVLLVLDSCEHLVEAVASLSETIIVAAPDVHLLTTSREPLRALGEWVIRLPPLELPPRFSGVGLAEALNSPAVQLFVGQARAADDTFTLSEDNAVEIIDICHRLDGIPLALEFAAARIGPFGAKELLARLDDRFTLLRSGRRTAVPRHRTLRATLDWSHDLLPPSEQVLFRRLAVFRGGFTLEAVQAIATVPGDAAETALDGIANLVSKSLLIPSRQGDETRYRLLETTRAYASLKLAQSGDDPLMARRLAEYLNATFQAAERDWATMTTPDWNRRYLYLIDDVRSSLDWAFTEAGDVALGAGLTGSSAPLWFSLGLVREYRPRADKALRLIIAAGIDAPNVEMQLNISFASATFNSDGPLPEKVASYARALEIGERMDDRDYQLRALWGLAGDYYLQGDYKTAFLYDERFDALAEASDDDAAKLVRDRLMALGLHVVGRQTEARLYAERALTHPASATRSTHKSFQEYDNRVASRSHLARILWMQGFPDRAVAIAREGLEIAQSLDYPPTLCYIIAFAACPVAFWTGDLVGARRYAKLMRGPASSLSFNYWETWHRVYDAAAGLNTKLRPSGLSEVLQRLGELAGRPVYGDMLATLHPALAGTASYARAADGSAGWCAPEILRVQALSVLREGGNGAIADAVDLLSRSLELSRRQGALSWELRSATSLAQLYLDNCDADAALETISPVFARFTEGFGTTDLRNATALLAKLKAGPV